MKREMERVLEHSMVELSTLHADWSLVALFTTRTWWCTAKPDQSKATRMSGSAFCLSSLVFEMGR